MSATDWFALACGIALFLTVEVEYRRSRRETRRIRQQLGIPEHPHPHDGYGRPHDWDQDDLPLWALEQIWDIRTLPETRDPV